MRPPPLRPPHAQRLEGVGWAALTVDALEAPAPERRGA
jgi:hypothetical protein